MAKKWSELVARMSPEQRARLAAEAARLRAEFPLALLRRQLDLSQQTVADRMGVSRTSVSRLEQQSRAHLRELRSYVEAMGGDLEITARFSEGEIRLDEWSRDLDRLRNEQDT